VEAETKSRLSMAIGISLGAHILLAVIAEGLSSGNRSQIKDAPVVEITRVAADGSPLPMGAGDARANSRSSAAQPDLGRTYGLDAGVPVRLATPPADRKIDPNPNLIPQVPTNSANAPINQPLQAAPNTVPYNQPYNQAPTNQAPMTQQSPPPPSNPSASARQGNLGQKRARGPNRTAIPIETVEPNVSMSQMASGVQNSVDVTVEIAADGSHSERIVRSSGSQEVDGLVLEAMAKWKWDPAAADGNPIASTQNFKFTFKPRE